MSQRKVAQLKASGTTSTPGKGQPGTPSSTPGAGACSQAGEDAGLLRRLLEKRALELEQAENALIKAERWVAAGKRRQAGWAQSVAGREKERGCAGEVRVANHHPGVSAHLAWDDEQGSWTLSGACMAAGAAAGRAGTCATGWHRSARRQRAPANTTRCARWSR